MPPSQGLTLSRVSTWRLLGGLMWPPGTNLFRSLQHRGTHRDGAAFEMPGLRPSTLQLKPAPGAHFLHMRPLLAPLPCGSHREVRCEPEHQAHFLFICSPVLMAVEDFDSQFICAPMLRALEDCDFLFISAPVLRALGDFTSLFICAPVLRALEDSSATLGLWLAQ